MLRVRQKLVNFIVVFASWNMYENKQVFDSWTKKESLPSNDAHFCVLQYWKNGNKYTEGKKIKN
jgi:hypothetical protein